MHQVSETYAQDWGFPSRKPLILITGFHRMDLDMGFHHCRFPGCWLGWVSPQGQRSTQSTDLHSRFASTFTKGRKGFSVFLRTGLDVPSLKSGIFVKRHCWPGQFPLSHVEFSTTTSTGLKRAGALLKVGPGETVRVEFEGALTKAELDRAQGTSSPSAPGTETTPLTPTPPFTGMDPIHALPGSSGLHLHQHQPRGTLK